MPTKKQNAEILRLNTVINAVLETLANYPEDLALHQSLQVAQGRVQALQKKINRKEIRTRRLS